MDIKKTIRNYTKIYRKVLIKVGITDIDFEISTYEKRLKEMYASDNFKRHSQYPTTNTVRVYAVIAMCLGLKKLNLSDFQIIESINNGFETRRNFFRRLLHGIDKLPITYQLVRKWNISDHDKREKDGSLVYDYFDISEEKIEYRISKCVYIEMFEQYGIRSLCKIFCMTDTISYENLPKHVQFIRHSDLSDGNCCHDEIIDKRKIKE